MAHYITLVPSEVKTLAFTLLPWFTGHEQDALIRFADAISSFVRSYTAVNVKNFGAAGDGLSNDTAAFANALLSASTYGGPIFVPAGTYLVDAVSLQTNTTIYGEGDLSILRPFTVAPQSILSVDGNNVEIHNLNLIAPKATYPDKVPIVAVGRSGVYAHDCRIEGGSTGFLGYNCTDSAVERLRVSGYINNGISFDSILSLRCHVIDCHVDGTGANMLSTIQIQNGSQCKATGNTSINSGGFGVFFGLSNDCQMEGNIVYNSKLEAFQMADSNRCVITDNIAAWPTTGGIGQDFGISLWSPNNTNTCDFNTISNNKIYNAPKAGISMQADVAGSSHKHNEIVGNYIHNPNQLNAEQWGAVHIFGGGCNGTYVHDNDIVSTDGKLYAGVREVSSINSRIGPNKILGPTFAKVIRTATSDEFLNGRKLADTGTGWVPVVTAETGAFTTLGTVFGLSYEMEKMVFVSMGITITTNGTAAGAIISTLPFSSPWPGILNGWEVGTKKQVYGICDGATVKIRFADGTYPGGNNFIIQLSGWYERA